MARADSEIAVRSGPKARLSLTRLGVLVGDDHPLILAGIQAVLRPSHEIMGTASNGRELVEEALRLKPDLVILDISMPELNGFEAARQIKTSLPYTKLIFVSMHTNITYLKKALDAGATGYVVTTGVAEELAYAVREVMAGHIWISPVFGPDALDSIAQLSGEDDDSIKLTGRQREVLQLIADGRSSKQIAHILRISVKTVDFHRGGIMARLSVHSAAELVRVAIERGLIPGSSSGGTY